jgi:acetolactate synthase small subunit
MPTFVVHARRSPETLARVLALFHRRVLEIERLTAERAQDPSLWRITITVEADTDLARRIEANLYKLGDVLLVERSESGQELVGERNPGTSICDPDGPDAELREAERQA